MKILRYVQPMMIWLQALLLKAGSMPPPVGSVLCKRIVLITDCSVWL
ncbi:hypothetical protein [Allocoleopsis franciscana]|nr:hypothetical protein [Allocoleopsis franciscana]